MWLKHAVRVLHGARTLAACQNHNLTYCKASIGTLGLVQGWGHCSHQKTLPQGCQPSLQPLCFGAVCCGAVFSPPRRLPRAGRAPGPGSPSTVPGWGPGGAARCERSPAPPLGATPSRSRCGAASSPAGWAPRGRPPPPPAAPPTAAAAAAQRRGPWRQPPEQRAGAGLPRKDGREGGKGRRPAMSAPARGLRAARPALSNGRAPAPPAAAPTAQPCPAWFSFSLQEARWNGDERSSNTVTSLSAAANALGALEKGWGSAVVGVSLNSGSLESWGFYMASDFHSLFSIKLQRHIKP